MAEENKIPAGSLPPEKPVEAPVQDKAEDNGTDYKKSFEELQKKFGEHSNEVGTLRKQNEELMNRLNDIETQSKKREEQALEQEPPTDYERELRTLANKFDEGEITAEELMLQSNKLTREQTMAEAESKYGNILDKASQQFQETLSARDQQAIVEQFNKQNPEFAEWQESGELEQVMQANPMHDELSAFYELKANKLAEQLEAKKLEAGSDPAKKVLSKPGHTIQQANKPKGTYTEAELRESALAAARAAAEG